jgi:hypothetical protein
MVTGLGKHVSVVLVLAVHEKLIVDEPVETACACPVMSGCNETETVVPTGIGGLDCKVTETE